MLGPYTDLQKEAIINQIISLNKGISDFWKNPAGWAPIEAAQLLSKSRLEWQVSLSKSLKLWQGRLDPDAKEGYLILAWVNLGALVEGTLKLFLSVYYEDYKKDIHIIKKKSNVVDPDTFELEKLRLFFRDGIWLSGQMHWDDWIPTIQQRRNAIHAFKNRQIGTFDEFFGELEQYLTFLQEIKSQLPYPDEGYIPR
jgi:hypothetical protein